MHRKVPSLIIAILLGIILLAGCGASMPASASPTPMPYVDIAPQRFADEQAFITALKNGEIISDFHPERITCYYKPKAIPDGATIQYVDVFSTYIIGVYPRQKQG